MCVSVKLYTRAKNQPIHSHFECFEIQNVHAKSMIIAQAIVERL